MFYIKSYYNTFISHSWDYKSDYNTILSWLMASNINLHDYSIPVEKALPPMSKTALRARITEEIRHASVVVILAGMYAAYSDWIDYEIDEAICMGKPILGVYPRGQERAPEKITSNADRMVHWNSDSVVKGFKQLV